MLSRFLLQVGALLRCDEGGSLFRPAQGSLPVLALLQLQQRVSQLLQSSVDLSLVLALTAEVHLGRLCLQNGHRLEDLVGDVLLHQRLLERLFRLFLGFLVQVGCRQQRRRGLGLFLVGLRFELLRRCAGARKLADDFFFGELLFELQNFEFSLFELT